MRLEFCNKKERKNCQYFIKALKEIEKYHFNNPQRPLFLTVTPNDLRLAPSLDDLHKDHLESSCLIIIKNDSFAV